MLVELVSVEDLSDDNMPLLAEVLYRLQQHQHVAKAVVIINKRSDGKRSEAGWLEFLVRVTYEDGGALTIGALQRKPGEQYEFHS